mgnify:CR=1 FL=1
MKDQTILRLAGILGGIFLGAYAASKGVDGALLFMAGSLIGFGIGVKMPAPRDGP